MTDSAELAQRLRSELDKRGWLLSETLFNDIIAAIEAVVEELENTCADAVNDMYRAEARLDSATKRIAELEAKLETAYSDAIAEHFTSSMEIAEGLQSENPETKAAAIERLYSPLKTPREG